MRLNKKQTAKLERTTKFLDKLEDMGLPRIEVLRMIFVEGKTRQEIISEAKMTLAQFIENEWTKESAWREAQGYEQR